MGCAWPLVVPLTLSNFCQTANIINLGRLAVMGGRTFRSKDLAQVYWRRAELARTQVDMFRKKVCDFQEFVKAAHQRFEKIMKEEGRGS